jgi:membrane dipeptidase
LQSGKTAAILAIEGGQALAGSLDNIEAFHDIGVKLITITWNESNELGHGCMSGDKSGLTTFGKEAVKRMERCGILPDVSHLNRRGFWDVMETAAGPVVATHSVSDKINPHPRNLTDEQFLDIRERGGVVGLNLCGEQLGKQSFEQLQRHLHHFLDLGGSDTVGFGCDFDGTDIPPEWGGLAVMTKIWEYLLMKNYDETTLDKLFFGNCYNFFKEL